MAKQTTTKKKANKKPAAKPSTKTKSTKAVATATPSKTTAPAVVPEKKTATPVAKSEAVKSAKAPKDPQDRLARWYRWTSIVLFLEALAVTLFGNKAATALTMQYPALDSLASEANGHPVLALASRHIADVHIAWAVSTFLLVFAVISGLLVTLYRPYFNTVLARGVNAFRWVALGIGGGVMIVAMALLSGFSSLQLLLSLFVLTMLAGMLALAADVLVARNNGVKTRFAHLLCGTALIAGLTPWAVFALAVIGKLLWHGHIPAYLYSIYGCQLALFVAVLLAMHFRLKRQGRWADALYADRSFLLLGFVAATVLAAQIFVGVLK